MGSARLTHGHRRSCITAGQKITPKITQDHPEVSHGDPHQNHAIYVSAGQKITDPPQKNHAPRLAGKSRPLPSLLRREGAVIREPAGRSKTKPTMPGRRS